MKQFILIIMMSSTVLIYCNCGEGGLGNTVFTANGSTKPKSNINVDGTTVKERFPPPAGFYREDVDSTTFAFYLRHLPLKAHGTAVKLFNGNKKWHDVHEAVIDIDVGERDLQQCADAVMRLRAEHLYSREAYKEIHFNFTNGFRVDYSKWMEGYRVKVDGNKTSWVKSSSPSNTYQTFRKYMDIIFAYAGTLSLSKELESVPFEELNAGDVFIRGGSPGHAVIIVDVVVNDNGEKLFMLAQSYMPAQDIHILKNPNNKRLSPWYNAAFSGSLETPEWTFEKKDLRRF